MSSRDTAYRRTGSVFIRACTTPPKKWFGKFGQIDNWLSCLAAAMLPRIRSEHNEANTPDTWINRIHPASPAYRIAAEPVLCSYGRSCERR